jgi:aspartyl-tRNA synthetase
MSDQPDKMKRTHSCGELRPRHISETVTIMGWAQSARDHGGVIFIDVRDRSGIVQVVVNPEVGEAFSVAEKIRPEYVVSARGVVRKRPPDTENPNLPTGEIEVFAQRLEILNVAKPPPFPLDEEHGSEGLVDENVRLKYRYIDLRRPRMQRNLRMRHKAAQAVREFLDAEGFWEIETPILFKQTPEGARDYIVPSRVNPGKFYALPQSPQLMKQILMVSGVERYYQLARCLRDEDLRADRQPEHTQIDIEMSFVDRDDVLDLCERLFRFIFKKAADIDLPDPFPRMTHAEAVARFGTDKPDMRFGMRLVDVSEIAAQSELKVFKEVIEQGGIVKGLNAKGAASFSRKELDDLVAFAQRHKAKGLAWIAFREQGPQSPIAKFFSDAQMQRLKQAFKVEVGDVVCFVADQPAVVHEALDAVRRRLAQLLGLIDPAKFAPLWVLDFPLFGLNEEGQVTAEHHPFCMPVDEDLELLETDPLSVRAKAYDIVINGVELGSGSIRIHRRDIQQKVFNVLGIGPEEAQRRFGFLLEAFEYGAPPHGGIAPGFDRIVMMMCGEPNIREVIAFPKTQSATCLLSGAPSEVDDAVLRELHIKVDLPPGLRQGGQ